MVIIGLAGQARSGKDTIGEYLIGRHQACTYALADPIRRAASEMFGLPYSSFTGNNPNREVKNLFWGISPREMLQKLGTEAGRNVFGEDIWLKRAEQELINVSEIASNPFFVITDIRFENEAQWVRTAGGIIVHIHRDMEESVNSHVSEHGIKHDSSDLTVHNNGTIEELFRKMDVVMDIIIDRIPGLREVIKNGTS